MFPNHDELVLNFDRRFSSYYYNVRSKKLLPKPFQELMTDEASPIFDYYPCSFETDLNGKKNDWEAVVLIPFIDEVRSNFMIFVDLIVGFGLILMFCVYYSNDY